MKKMLFVVFMTLCGLLIVVGYFGKKSEDRYSLKNKADSITVPIIIWETELFPKPRMEDFPIDLEEAADGTKVIQSEMINNSPIQKVTPIMPKQENNLLLFILRIKWWQWAIPIVFLYIFVTGIFYHRNTRRGLKI